MLFCLFVDRNYKTNYSPAFPSRVQENNPPRLSFSQSLCKYLEHDQSDLIVLNSYTNKNLLLKIFPWETLAIYPSLLEKHLRQ